jgi:hypothetical protein
LWLLNFSRFREAVLASGLLLLGAQIGRHYRHRERRHGNSLQRQQRTLFIKQICVAVIDEAAATTAGTRT